MSHINADYVKYMLATDRNSTIVFDLLTQQISFVPTVGIDTFYPLDSFTKANQGQKEQHWKEFVRLSKKRNEDIQSPYEELNEEVQEFILQTIQKKHK